MREAYFFQWWIQVNIIVILLGVLEATYDHPPSQSIRSCRSSEGQRSLAEMWEEVMSAAASNKAAEQAEQEQQLQSQLQEEEHLYQEIPCYHPRVEVHDSRCWLKSLAKRKIVKTSRVIKNCGDMVCVRVQKYNNTHAIANWWKLNIYSYFCAKVMDFVDTRVGYFLRSVWYCAYHVELKTEIPLCKNKNKSNV